MVRFITISFLAIVLASCGNANSNTSQNNTPVQNTPPKPDYSANPDYKKGRSIVKQHDCLSCHHETKKLTGPAYQEIANKFENNEANIKLLADKIINGSQGDWGSEIMTPHPGLSKEDAEQMVKYIFVLKNK